MEDKVLEALYFAYMAHKNQKDKAGKPYILHPMYVALQVDTKEEKIVALLHDVVEDTSISIEEIENIFGKDIANAVDVLTHKNKENYFKYISKIKNNPIAVKVKLADLKNNMDLSRLKNPTEKDFLRLEKYKKAKFILESDTV